MQMSLDLNFVLGTWMKSCNSLRLTEVNVNVEYLGLQTRRPLKVCTSDAFSHCHKWTTNGTSKTSRTGMIPLNLGIIGLEFWVMALLCRVAPPERSQALGCVVSPHRPFASAPILCDEGPGIMSWESICTLCIVTLGTLSQSLVL